MLFKRDWHFLSIKKSFELSALASPKAKAKRDLSATAGQKAKFQFNFLPHKPIKKQYC